MLTISQLARYAGVTVKAVRHYHKIGLLPEPPRNRSGYRTYDAAAVVLLIRINVLASAGVPLAQVKDVLNAGPEKLTGTVQEIDKYLRREIGRLRRSRKSLAMLAAGDQIALPTSVAGYLDRLRGLGVEERYITMERDAWIMIAAQVPDRIDSIIARKHQDLDDPDLQRLYGLVNDAPDVSADDPRVIEAADILSRLYTKATQSNTLNVDGLDDQFVDLLDDTMLASAPAAGRLMALLKQRGWQGWHRVEPVPTSSARPQMGPTEDDGRPRMAGAAGRNPWKTELVLEAARRSDIGSASSTFDGRATRRQRIVTTTSPPEPTCRR